MEQSVRALTAVVYLHLGIPGPVLR